MIKVATVDQTRAIEEAADAAGYSYKAMMEQAGRLAADRALTVLEAIEEPRVTVLVGPGNNGGDGLVTGLLIAQDRADADVRFYLLTDRDDDYTQTANEAGLMVVTEESDSDKRLLRQMVASADLVIDALFGIGVRLPIRDAARKMLQQTNRALNERRRTRPDTLTITLDETGQVPQPPPIYVMAIDCPSGLDCDSGELDSNAIAADETVTFITAKRGQFLFPGANAVGRLTVADIGTPKDTEAHQAVTLAVADSDSVRQILPERKLDSHKGTYGKVMMAAGSLNYTGAPALCAEAAYRAGAGLVTVGVPGVVAAALAGSLREVTWLMLPHDMGVIADGATAVLMKEIADYDVLLIGPGLGTEKTTRDFLHKLLDRDTVQKPASGRRKIGFQIGAATANDDDSDEDDEPTLPPLVIDADGLNLLAKMDNWPDLLPAETILTPHPGEMGRLADMSIADVQANRLELAQEKASEWGCVLVLKGAHTVIAAPDGQVVLLPFKVDALATAGTGDVLAGLIVGLRAQGLSAFDAAVAGGYVHGIAGKQAAGSSSERSVLAGDVLAAIGDALAVIDG